MITGHPLACDRRLPRQGVFERWKEPGEFEQVYIDEETGTIAWPGGLNVAPDRLYRDVKPDRGQRARSG